MPPSLATHTPSLVSFRSSVGEVQWEAEFFALQDSNQRLAGALREANAAAAQWRQQLEAQRAEAERLRQRVRTLAPPPVSSAPFQSPEYHFLL